MIDLAGIRAKALRLYPQVLRDSLAAALSTASPSPPRLPFPLDISADRGRSTEPFADRRAGIERLHRGSRERTGLGYALEYREVLTRREGRQSVVSRIFFPTLADYLAFLGKEREHAEFLAEAGRALARLPGLQEWIREQPLRFLNHLGEWEELSRICEYLLAHPRPGCYLRQIPVAVHTKFIEEHQGILRSLLDRLLPPSTVDRERTDFEGRFGLRRPQRLVRLRYLDPALTFHGWRDVGLPPTELRRLEIRCRTAFIVENRLTFLAFPEVAGAVCIWGSGFRAARLGRLPWLREPRLLYWGDIDRAGFEILAALRRALPQAESMLMDRQTWSRYEQFVVADRGARRPHPAGPPEEGFPPGGPAAPLETLLTPAERELYAALRQNPGRGRLEQERVTHAHLQEFLREQGFSLLEG